MSVTRKMEITKLESTVNSEEIMIRIKRSIEKMAREEFYTRKERLEAAHMGHIGKSDEERRRGRLVTADDVKRRIDKRAKKRACNRSKWRQ